LKALAGFLLSFLGLGSWSSGAVAAEASAADAQMQASLGASAAEERTQVDLAYGNAALQPGYMAINRPIGIAEFGVGAFALPGAEICGPGSCAEGDVSVELDAWQLYRPDLRLAIGAGITMALFSTVKPPREDPQGISREHSRGYLTIEAVGRYYYYVARTFEAWAGLTSGLVVLKDGFADPNRTELPLLGTKGTIIRSEALTLGAAMGATLALSPNWSIVASARYGSWFLPSTPAVDPFGDEASLVGRTNVVAVGLGLGYRIPL
jgi:hypothetical protein